jgi:hypothetical protein
MSCASNQIPFKRGSSFVADLESLDDAGAPDTAPASAFSASFNTPEGTNLSTAVVTNPSPGVYRFTVADTTGWPLGAVVFDIKRNHGGVVWHTATQTIHVGKAETP